MGKFWLPAVLCSAGALFGQGTLVLSSGAASAGSAALNLTLSAPAAGPPAGLQWTLAYSPADFLSVNVAAAAAATAAGKTTQCVAVTGRFTCLLVGRNSTSIPNGVVAVVNVTLAAGVASAAMAVTNAQGATVNGYYLALTGTGGTVTPAAAPTLTGLSCTPSSLVAGGSSTCTVTLSKSGGGTVALASNNPALSVPASVPVAAGATTATFAAAAGAIAADQSATVTASLNGASQTAAIALLTPPVITAVACTPSNLVAGGSSACTVTLSKNTGGTVALASNNPALSVPASVSVAAGATTATFAAAAGAIAADQSATVTASLNGASQTAAIALLTPPVLTAVACTPSNLVAGGSSACAVTLSKNTGGTVALASNNPALSVPASVSVAAGATTATFAAAAGAITADQSATVTASLNGSTGVASVLLHPAAQGLITSLGCLPDPAAAGALNCVIQLTQAAPAGGASVALQSSSVRVQLPSQIQIQAGAQSVTFPVRVLPSDQDDQALITASFQGAVRTMQLSIAGIRPTALLLSTTAVQAGTWLNGEVQVSASNIPDSVLLAVAGNSPDLRLPDAIPTRPGQTRVGFRAFADPAAKPQNASIAVGFGQTSVKAPVVVMPSPTPILSLPDHLAARFDEEAACAVSAVDPLGLPVTLSAGNLPAGAGFDAATGRFSWTPGRAQKGVYDIAFTAINSAGASSAGHMRVVVDSGRPLIGGLHNAASRTGPVCSPGSLATVEGLWLTAGNAGVSEPSGSATALGGARIKVNGQYLPVVYASQERMDFVCPALVPGTALLVSVENQAGESDPVSTDMAAISPGLFSLDGSGSGQGMVYLAGTSLLATTRDYRALGRPAEPGDPIAIRATGMGSPDGLPPVVMLGGFRAQVDSVKAVPGMAGVAEISIRVPPGIQDGDSIPVIAIFRPPAPTGLRRNRPLRAVSNQITVAIESGRL